VLIDLPLHELRALRPSLPEPEGFADFWSATLAAARLHPIQVQRTPWHVQLPHVSVDDVTFRGYGGQPVRAWFLRPAAATGALPCIVTYEGYGGGRGLPHEWLFWTAAGASVLVVDNRGQGSGHRVGATADVAPPSGPHQNGFLTLGIESPETYYYRRLLTDAVRAVEAARSLVEVDTDRIVVTGVSQGGGMTLAVAGLVDGLAAVLPDVPFLCDIARACTITDAFPYQELRLWLRMHREQAAGALRTVSFADALHFAPRATAPALFSVGLMDECCPPSTVFGAYNRYAGPKDIVVWEYAGHEGGGPDQALHQLAFLRRLGVLATPLPQLDQLVT
jgi:cephalosporin-C deacetylase